ncbi:MAG: tyrosine-type recombinase/integrase [Alphaproteobacteria bacterium]
MPTYLDLAEAKLDALALPNERIVIWDKMQKGLGVRISPNGVMTYVVKVRLGRGRFAAQRLVSLGRVGQLSIKNVRLEAQNVLARALTKAQPEPRPAVEFNDAVTISKLCDMWLEKAAHRRRGRGPLAGTLRKPENVENDRGRIEAHIRPLLGKIRVRELNRSMIEAYRDAVSRGDTRLTKKGQRKRGVTRIRGGEGTANRSLALLSSIMSFAVREEIMAHNPVFGIERSPRKFPRTLSQSRGIWPPRRDHRQGRAQGGPPLWHCDHSSPGAFRRAQKRDRTAHLVCCGSADGIFASAALKDGTQAYSDHRRDARDHREDQESRRHRSRLSKRGQDRALRRVKKMWVGIRGAAGFPDVRLHDLRHSAASFALMSGVGLEVIGKLLGHSDVKTTRRYAHLADVVVRTAAEQTADQIANLMAFGASPASPAIPAALVAASECVLTAAPTALVRVTPRPGARRALNRQDGRRPARG